MLSIDVNAEVSIELFTAMRAIVRPLAQVDSADVSLEFALFSKCQSTLGAAERLLSEVDVSDVSFEVAI